MAILQRSATTVALDSTPDIGGLLRIPPCVLGEGSRWVQVDRAPLA